MGCTIKDMDAKKYHKNCSKSKLLQQKFELVKINKLSFKFKVLPEEYIYQLVES